MIQEIEREIRLLKFRIKNLKTEEIIEEIKKIPAVTSKLLTEVKKGDTDKLREIIYILLAKVIELEKTIDAWKEYYYRLKETLGPINESFKRLMEILGLNDKKEYYIDVILPVRERLERLKASGYLLKVYEKYYHQVKKYGYFPYPGNLKNPNVWMLLDLIRRAKIVLEKINREK